MKIITFTGRLTKDAQMKRTPTGTPVLEMSVASDNGYGDRKKTDFFDVALFGDRGGKLEPHLIKGKAVEVCGEFSTFTAESGKTYLKVNAYTVEFAQGGSGGEKPAQKAPQRSLSEDMNDDFPDF